MGNDIEFDQSEARKILPALDNLGGDTQQGRSYIDGYMSLTFAEEGIINRLSGGHEAVRTAVDDRLGELRTYFATTLSENFDATFRLYETNEAAEEATLRTLEEFYRADARMVADLRRSDSELWGSEPATGRRGQPFAPPEQPDGHYTPVSVGGDGIEGVQQPPGVLDYFSFTFYVRYVVEFVTGHDPLELIGRPIAGDWDQFVLISKALRNLADGLRAVVTNLVAHVDQLEAVWDGNAYMACNLAVHNAAKEIQDGMVQPLEDAADLYEEAAAAAHQTYQDLAPAISAVIDIATGIGLVKALLSGASKASARLLGEKVDWIAARTSEFQAAVQAANSGLESVSREFTELKAADSVPPVLAEYQSR
ncbi:hypothetical protein [Streptomyces sp. HNM0574]|uniref:hypothetical protein n=1 Tax=Streptomyces sp. HNM0574 TaxID=2714954 RepID=UPI00146D802E|nr:hypothetical protein [Streptomyces sp. HNM0574]NLU70532.1 hypothetical protein [Streptomyces sp. HNM0574]